MTKKYKQKAPRHVNSGTVDDLPTVNNSTNENPGPSTSLAVQTGISSSDAEGVESSETSPEKRW